jgi:alpha-L-fucosidase
MKKIILSMMFVTTLICNLWGQTVQPKAGDWFEAARFGMFIHFGPYSVLGDGEWVMHNRNIPGKDYKRLQQLFNPWAFDAAEWVKTAKDAGMKYITFTSRHHDSFSNWDTKQSDWNIMNTPYGKDLVRQLSDECKRQDMKLIIYYSLLDWMRSDYQYETGHTGRGTGRTEKSDWPTYISFMKAQLTELLTNYDVAGIWFDGHWDQAPAGNRTETATAADWHYDEIYGLIHRLKPGCLVANNHHLPPLPGEDYQVFERDVPGENKAGHSGQAVSSLPLETCETINDTWGFSITDNKFKSVKDIIRLLVYTAGQNGNLLLNVGPMPNGKIQDECVTRLEDVGRWMKKYGYTIYGTHQGFSKIQPWGAVTQKENTHYIHILDSSPQVITLHIPNIRVKSAGFINVDGKLNWKQSGDFLTLNLYGQQLDDIDSIIEVKIK